MQCEETYRYSESVEIRCINQAGHGGNHAGFDPASLLDPDPERQPVLFAEMARASKRQEESR